MSDKELGMENQLDVFFSNVKNRFVKSPVSELSEDCIRYDFFASYFSRIETYNIILEYPHPDDKNKEIDCVIKHKKNKIEALEFKFFRPIPSNKTTPQTQLLGQMIKDIYKLIAFKNADVKRMIVVANNRMGNYINNQFKLFENMGKKNIIINIDKNDLDKKEKTFQKNIKPYKNIDICLKRIFCKDIIKDSDTYIISVFEILKI
jgi:hypothetical protein